MNNSFFQVREGREADAVAFTELHQRLQKSPIVKNREAILTLFLNLADTSPTPSASNTAPSSTASNRRKAAPFSIGSGSHHPLSARGKGVLMQNGGLGNGKAAAAANVADTPTYLSSIHEIRSKSGFHPPVPPKPREATALLEERRRSQSPPPRSSRSSKAGTYEKELVRELIFSFQGIEGQILRRTGPDGGFAVSESYRKKYPISVVQTCLRLSELGWLYCKVNAFCEQVSDEGREAGLIGQSLVTAVKNELSEYYRLLSALETQLRETEGGLSLHNLAVWMVEPANRLRLLASVVEAARGQRGGALISTVYSFLHHGDPAQSEAVRSLLCTICRPMYLMLLRWICDGTLEDPYEEFFIASDPKVPAERMWQDKYSIRSSMIPKFITLSWAKKILATGKSINYLHEVRYQIN